jgi:two-component sensor histidine kinase
MIDRLHANRVRQPELELQADELRTMTRLHELADLLLGISSLPTGLGEVLDAAMEVFHSDRGTIQILDPEAGVLRYGASRGFDERMLAAVPPIDRDFHSTCAACIRTGERVVAEDIASDPKWTDHASIAAELGYGAAFSTPMKTRRDELLGVLTVHFEEAYTPSDIELRWADLFARLAAHLIERARSDTALRETGERQQVLLQELQHRTRNLLGVVRSITNRTLEASSSLDEFGESFRERLAALARVNGLLSRLTEGDRITFDELIRTELSGHGIAEGDGRGDQVQLSGPENIRLRSSTVQTLALGLHELTTNAIKYGALSKPYGRLSISWSVENGADERRLKVNWEETGVAPELDSAGETLRKGYGRELIEQALPYQLKADTKYEITPDGVRCMISLPISTTQ